MIMRIFQATIRPGKEAEFADFFHNTAIPLMKSTDGVVQVLPGAARKSTPREFSFVMVWRDLKSLQAFVGEEKVGLHHAAHQPEFERARRVEDLGRQEELPSPAGADHAL